jgi:hypothetical protein
MDESTARAIARQAEGWIQWDDFRQRPDGSRGKIVLDRRFSADELRAILQFERKK